VAGPRPPLGRDRSRVALLIVAVGLAGAAAFGLWHVVVGGFAHGNGRAATFGAVLAVVAGLLLVVDLAVVRRRSS
jgi:hypothetical protein